MEISELLQGYFGFDRARETETLQKLHQNFSDGEALVNFLTTREKPWDELQRTVGGLPQGLLKLIYHKLSSAGYKIPPLTNFSSLSDFQQKILMVMQREQGTQLSPWEVARRLDKRQVAPVSRSLNLIFTRCTGLVRTVADQYIWPVDAWPNGPEQITGFPTITLNDQTNPWVNWLVGQTAPLLRQLVELDKEIEVLAETIQKKKLARIDLHNRITALNNAALAVEQSTQGISLPEIQKR